MNIPGLNKIAETAHDPSDLVGLSSRGRIEELRQPVADRLTRVNGGVDTVFHGIIQASYSAAEIAELAQLTGNTDLTPQGYAASSVAEVTVPGIPTEHNVGRTASRGQDGQVTPPAVEIETNSGFLDGSDDPLARYIWDGDVAAVPEEQAPMAEFTTPEAFFAQDWSMMPPNQQPTHAPASPHTGNQQPVVPAYDTLKEAGMASPVVDESVQYWNGVQALPELSEAPTESAINAERAKWIADAQARVNQVRSEEAL